MDKVIRAKGGGCLAILLQCGQEGFPWSLEGGWFPSCCGYGRERLACGVPELLGISTLRELLDYLHNSWWIAGGISTTGIQDIMFNSSPPSRKR